MPAVGFSENEIPLQGRSLLTIHVYHIVSRNNEVEFFLTMLEAVSYRLNYFQLERVYIRDRKNMNQFVLVIKVNSSTSCLGSFGMNFPYMIANDTISRFFGVGALERT